jgi:hypothetical protein
MTSTFCVKPYPDTDTGGDSGKTCTAITVEVKNNDTDALRRLILDQSVLPRTAERTTTAPLSSCSMCKVWRSIRGLCWCGSILPPDPRCHLHTSIASERQIKDSRTTPTHRPKWASASRHTCLPSVSHQESGTSCCAHRVSVSINRGMHA